jgi:hypothetical protein
MNDKTKNPWHIYVEFKGETIIKWKLSCSHSFSSILSSHLWQCFLGGVSFLAHPWQCLLESASTWHILGTNSTCRTQIGKSKNHLKPNNIQSTSISNQQQLIVVWTNIHNAQQEGSSSINVKREKNEPNKSLHEIIESNDTTISLSNFLTKLWFSKNCCHLLDTFQFIYACIYRHAMI